MIYDDCKVRGIENSILKEILWNKTLTSVSVPEYICNICSRVCLFKAGLTIHISHDSYRLQADFTQVVPQQPTVNSC